MFQSGYQKGFRLRTAQGQAAAGGKSSTGTKRTRPSRSSKNSPELGEGLPFNLQFKGDTEEEKVRFLYENFLRLRSVFPAWVEHVFVTVGGKSDDQTDEDSGYTIAACSPNPVYNIVQLMFYDDFWEMSELLQRRVVLEEVCHILQANTLSTVGNISTFFAKEKDKARIPPFQVTLEEAVERDVRGLMALVERFMGKA